MFETTFLIIITKSMLAIATAIEQMPYGNMLYPGMHDNKYIIIIWQKYIPLE